ncbi:MAG: uridine monophosphate kinase, partial [Planctomycetota bacterium]
GRLRADQAGMLSTVINALVFQDALEKRGVDACVYSGLGVEGAVPRFDSDRARSDLADGKVVIFAGGTGNPLFTTDTAAALRGIQMGVDIILKATRVDGVFSSDPENSDDAQRFDHLDYHQVLSRRLGVMDLCAVSLCMEHRLPVRVFNYQQKDNIYNALSGKSVGTLIGAKNHGHG